MCRFPGTQFEETLAAASAGLLRKMLRGFAQRMMDAEVEVRCQYGEVTPERVNSRNGVPAPGAGHPGQVDHHQRPVGVIAVGVPGS